MAVHSVKMQSQIAKTELRILKKICREIDTPRSLAVYLLADSQEFNQLLNLSIRPNDYDSASAFADDYLVTEMLKKSQAISTDVNLTDVAYEKWLNAERQCKETNDRLSAFSANLVTPTKSRVTKIIARAIDLCHQILGPLTRSTLTKINDSSDFGPGATTACRGYITRGRKFSSRELKTTQRMLSYGLFCLPDIWKREGLTFTLQDYNELTFVPKNAKTHRSITIENDLNIYLQKGIGSVMKVKLRNFGLDVVNQWTINQKLARQAHELSLATIDLSSASDTLSLNLVQLFVPNDWFELLCLCRPDFTKYGDEIHTLEKFSGMGNGYTFELETMIFYSVLLACREYNNTNTPVTAFGDDLVCSVDIMDDVIETLKFLGFSVNSEKTFGKGRFHESCGGDYFDGINVRPFYLRFGRFHEEEVFHRYRYCNVIRRYARHRNGGFSCDSRFLPAWLDCFCRIPKTLRIFVSGFEYEEYGVVGNFDEAGPAIKCNRLNGYSGYIFRGYVRKQIATTRFARGAYIGALHKMTDWTSGREPVRNRQKSAKFQNFYTLSWVDLGAWI